MRIERLIGLAVVVGMLSGVYAAVACPADREGVLFDSCAGPTAAHLVLLDGSGQVLLPEDSRSILMVTGAYTSGEAREPEGMFLIAGRAVDPHPQGWDGLMLLDARGDVSLHHIERVTLGTDLWNLRDRAQRAAFLAEATAGGWSALQSHMLVIDGEVDTSPRANAPRYARRVLYAMADGHYGIYDTSPRRLTLHEMAVEVAERIGPRMALNLDMGSYDFCLRVEAGETRYCGALPSTGTAKLSNLIVFDMGQRPLKAASRAQ